MNKKSGPISHRIMIYFFSAVLTLLLIWSIDYLLSDIGNIPGPSRKEIEMRFVGNDLIKEQKSLKSEKKKITTQIKNETENQKLLEIGMSGSKDTMNQLLNLHRLALEKNVRPTLDQQNALAESQTLYLSNQKEFQTANAQISNLTKQQQDLEQQINLINQQVTERLTQSETEFNNLLQAHRWKMAGLKLLVILPLLAGSTWLLIKKRKSDFSPLIFSFLIATFFETGTVMHQYFPAKFFRYIVIGVAITATLIILRHLIRLAVSPQMDWLLKQYREAYKRWRCPTCNFPIRRGIRKEIDWGSSNLRGAIPIQPESIDKEEKPYTCPSCGQHLFEVCLECQQMRHTLLPFCHTCSHQKEIRVG